ncbi:hypothetical protein COOONC_26085 [Cooperia oncophora]
MTSKRSKIRAVFNLEESGEHSFCGSGNLVGGFSYDPERLMRNEIVRKNARIFQYSTTTSLCLILKFLQSASAIVDIVSYIYELTRG